MISEDAANLGVKAIYIWAGLLVPTVVILYFFYPEVSAESRSRMQFGQLTRISPTDRPLNELTTSWTSCTSVVSRPVTSRRL